MKVQQIKRRSFVWTFANSPDWNLNVQLIRGERFDYVIDTGLGSESMRPVKEKLTSGKPIIIINTHFHWDHIWGNAALDAAMIVSHQLCRKRMETRWDEMIRKNGSYIDGDAVKRLPDIVFDEGLYFPDDGIRVFYSPGHTEDGIGVLDEYDGVLNVGDNIGDDREHIMPDLECDKTVYDASLRHYIKTGADTVVSGHNDVMNASVFEEIRKRL